MICKMKRRRTCRNVKRGLPILTSWNTPTNIHGGYPGAAPGGGSLIDVTLLSGTTFSFT